jgi:CubicO group peptidase (beta-lactamase class C family)
MPWNFDVVDDIIAEFHGRRHAPGVQVGVIAPGGTVHVANRGIVDCAAGDATGPERVFRIASMSKSFTAAAILQLRDQCLLHLDDPVIRHLPGAVGLAGRTSDSPHITVRQCLTMSSGLPSDDPWADRQEEMPQAAFDDLLAHPVAGAYSPGTAFAYSNLGYAILGRIVEAITGRRFIDHVQGELLNPLGLTNTTYDYRSVAPERLERGYRLTREGDWESQQFTAPGSFSAIGGLLSTALDIGRWMGWLSDAFPPRDGPDDTVLSRASRREMQQAHRLVPFDLVDGSAGQTRLMSRGFPWGLAGYGYGLFVESSPQWGEISQHLGGYPGFGSYMGWHQASGVGVVAFANGTYAPVAEPARAILDSLLQQGRTDPAQSRPSLLRSVLQIVERVIADPLTLQEPAFAANVLLDIPLDERIAAISDARELLGEFTGQSEIEMRSPSEATCRLPATRGRLDVSVAMTPTDPPRIQTFALQAVERR